MLRRGENRLMKKLLLMILALCCITGCTVQSTDSADSSTMLVASCKDDDVQLIIYNNGKMELVEDNSIIKTLDSKSFKFLEANRYSLDSNITGDLWDIAYYDNSGRLSGRVEGYLINNSNFLTSASLLEL